MELIDTANYGEQVLTSLEPIPGNNELFLGKINVESGEEIGILDKNNEEVVPFGNITDLLGITFITPELLVIDKIGVIKYPDITFNKYGSYLCSKDDKGHFKVIYDSNAVIFNIDDEFITGANFYPDECGGPIQIFLFNYKTGEIEKSEIDYESYDSGELQDLLDSKVSPDTTLSRRLKGKI